MKTEQKLYSTAKTKKTGETHRITNIEDNPTPILICSKTLMYMVRNDRVQHNIHNQNLISGFYIDNDDDDRLIDGKFHLILGVWLLQKISTMSQ